jgi:tryptophan-rich sensory protein
MATALCRAGLPLAVVLASACLSPADLAQEPVPWQPPPWVFRSIWPVLALLLGLAWGWMPAGVCADALVLLLLASIGSFTFVAARCGRAGEPYAVAVAFGLAVALVQLTPAPQSLLLVPLLAWLFVAGLLAASRASATSALAGRCSEGCKRGN